MSIVDCRSAAASNAARHHASFDTRHSTFDPRPPAFTLIELLVVIGIIGIVVALGVPLFGVLTGSRSQEAGQNLVAAAIGQARTIAVNEGKYAGILFYVDPATDRTAMSVVIIADPASGLEDPDPYDKYKTWTTGGTPTYHAPGYDPTTNAPIYGDRTIGLASDASGTFRAEPGVNVYTPTTSTVYSRLSNYFGNMKPTVRVYRAKKDSTATAASLTQSPQVGGVRPPQNGPLTSQLWYNRIPPTGVPITAGAAGTAPVVTDGNGFNDSASGRFSSDYWVPDKLEQIAPYSTGGEQQLLPIGVGVQLIIQPSARSDTTAFSERYVRTGLIMFDPQGRLTLDPRGLSQAGTLGKYLGLTADATVLPAAVGVVFYDNVAFKGDATRTDADWYTQNNGTNTTARITATAPAFNDNATVVSTANEIAEETWLDGNTVPLLINRFSGALSEGQ